MTSNARGSGSIRQAGGVADEESPPACWHTPCLPWVAGTLAGRARGPAAHHGAGQRAQGQAPSSSQTCLRTGAVPVRNATGAGGGHGPTSWYSVAVPAPRGQVGGLPVLARRALGGTCRHHILMSTGPGSAHRGDHHPLGRALPRLMGGIMTSPVQHRPATVSPGKVRRPSDKVSDNRHRQRWTPADTPRRSAAGHTCCGAGSPRRNLASGRRGRRFESGHPDQLKRVP